MEVGGTLVFVGTLVVGVVVSSSAKEYAGKMSSKPSEAKVMIFFILNLEGIIYYEIDKI